MKHRMKQRKPDYKQIAVKPDQVDECFLGSFEEGYVIPDRSYCVRRLKSNLVQARSVSK
jgi:hypothetical protein